MRLQHKNVGFAHLRRHRSKRPTLTGDIGIVVQSHQERPDQKTTCGSSDQGQHETGLAHIPGAQQLAQAPDSFSSSRSVIPIDVKSHCRDMVCDTSASWDETELQQTLRLELTWINRAGNWFCPHLEHQQQMT